MMNALIAAIVGFVIFIGGIVYDPRPEPGTTVPSDKSIKTEPRK